MFKDLNLKTFQNWPVIDKKLLEKDKFNLWYKLMEKKRIFIETNKDISEKE